MRCKAWPGSPAFEITVEIFKSTFESGEDALISGFGKFEVRDKNPRKGRNPASGNDLILDGRWAVSFKCSKVFKAEIEREEMNRKHRLIRRCELKIKTIAFASGGR